MVTYLRNIVPIVGILTYVGGKLGICHFLCLGLRRDTFELEKKLNEARKKASDLKLLAETRTSIIYFTVLCKTGEVMFTTPYPPVNYQ